MTGHDDIRSMLRRRADDVSPRHDQNALDRQLNEARPPGHRGRLALVGAAVLVVLVGVAALLGPDHAGEDRVRTAEQPQTSTTVVYTTTTTAPRTTTTIPATFDAGMPVTIAGLGPLDMGLDLAEVEAQYELELHLDPANTMPDTECAYLDVQGVPGLAIMLDGDRLVRVDVDSDSPVRTDRGIGVGDTQAALSTAYPEATIADGFYDGFGLTVVDPDQPDFELIFQTDGSQVVAFRSGLSEFVGWIEGCA